MKSKYNSIMKTNTTYRIIGRTNGWIADRDILFKGKCKITLSKGNSLREAQIKILEMFNQDYNTFFQNWGLARMNHPYITWSYKDGTRGYEYDSRYYEIEEEEATY